MKVVEALPGKPGKNGAPTMRPGEWSPRGPARRFLHGSRSDSGLGGHGRRYGPPCLRRGIEFIFKDFTGEGDNDPHDYGTHVLATICGRAIDGRRIGVVPGVGRVLLAKALSKQGSGSSQTVFDGTLWAAREGAQVHMVSAGFDFPGAVARLVTAGTPPELAAATTLETYRFNLRLFEALATICGFNRPCLLIAPSGNESRREIPGH